MCLYPKLILNRKYIPNKKNGGAVPQMTDPRTKWVPVGCGKCMECKKQKSRAWSIRLQEEIRTDKTGKFVTMTFSDEWLVKIEEEVKKDYQIEGYELENQIAVYAVRHFLERWRKKYGTSVKHWLVTELGQKETERIHVHGIIWATAKDVTDGKIKTVRKKVLEELWKYGNVNKQEKDWEKNYVNEATVNYIVKYISKADIKHKEYDARVLTSKGIGSKYIDRPDARRNKYNGGKTIETYTTRQGIKLNLPKYYRNKIYTEEEKEELWINLMNKEERWVNGVRIDISKGEEDYWNMIKEARQQNNKLGYGNDEKSWERKQYENQRREIRADTRRKKVEEEKRRRENTN